MKTENGPRTEPVFARIGAGLEILKNALDIQDTENMATAYNAGPDQLYTQTIRLPVTGVSAARKIIHLQIARLSPLPPEQILWDVIKARDTEPGPVPSDHAYILAIIRRDLVQNIAGPVAAHARFTSGDGNDFRFTLPTGLARLGRKTAMTALFAALTYAAGLWTLYQWTERLDSDARSINRQAALLGQQITENRAEISSAGLDLERLENHALRSNTTHILETLLAASKNLSEPDGIIRISISPTETNLAIVTPDPAAVMNRLTARFPESRVQQTQISSDRRTSLSRMNVRIIPPVQVPESKVTP